MAFDQYKALLQDADGKISGPRTVIAGFGAGVTESLLAVTPFESIKTTLYAMPDISVTVWYLTAIESMTARVPTPECEDSFTQSPSSPANEVSEGSSKASSPPLPAKQRTAQFDSDPTPSSAN